MSAAALRALAPIVARQFGVFTTAQAEAVGVGRSTLSRMVRSGDLVRLHRGVYAIAVYPDSWERRWMAGLLAAGPESAISHHAAAHLHDLQHTGTRRRPLLELTTPREAVLPSIDGVRQHTQVAMTPADVVRIGPWRVTSATWTLATLAILLGVSRLERAVGAAVARGQVTIADLGAVTARRRCAPGVPALRMVLLRVSPEVRLTRSEAERLFLRLVEGAGLPPPKVNLRVVDAQGRRRYLDFAWPEWGVFVEIDVHPDHAGTIGRNHDGHRQNDLVPTWKPLRFDEVDLRFGAERVVAQVTRTLRAVGAPV